jgi:hypothetical protein
MSFRRVLLLFESFEMGVISGVKLVMKSYWMLTKTLNGLLNVGKKETPVFQS